VAATIGEQERKILDAANYAHVATLREDGTVHGVVVWLNVEDGKVLLNSAEGRAWPKNVRRDPRVTITVANHDNPYEYVEVRGKVVEDTHDGADEHINALAKKYLDQDEYPFRQPGEQRIRFAVEPERVRYAGG
jgi:PPOX class probable F420-dependent enzyme